jgi:plasmid stabilization system protein ParE
MAYRVEITPQALSDADAATRFIAEHSRQAATRRLDRLLVA